MSGHLPKDSSRILAVTMGCPAGIGPEIVVKYYAALPSTARQNVVVLGDAGVLRKGCRDFSIDLPVIPWLPGDKPSDRGISVYSLSNLAEKLTWGQPTIETGRAMAAYIEKAVELCLNRQVAGMVTCPITKQMLNAAGFSYPGHTEMLAALSGTREYAMMMAGKKLRVVLVTIHTSLASVSDRLDREQIAGLIDLCGRSLQIDFSMPKPSIGVAGFNPHAGEDGLFGCEEEKLIVPAIEDARRKGWDVSGPLPPDTVFLKASQGSFDAVVAMYHDQGLIPFKLLHFKDGVNVTIGLPIVRTSVDHGTAYDIAGRGVADFTSLAAAVDLASVIAHSRAKKIQ